MGMFDYIKCEMPLPATPTMPPDGTVFQTKDTDDMYLTVYTIKSDGRLVWRPYKMEEVPPHERPQPDTEHPDHWIGSFQRVEAEEEGISFDGDLVFYHWAEGWWWEYCAKFCGGVATEITVVDFHPPKSNPTP